MASGGGTFQFTVGSGAVQSVAVDGTTTLQGLADAINALGAGVTASAVNLGTAVTPDYRLQIVSQNTGAASTIAVVQDGTTLGVQATQAGLDAQFTVGGFAGTFSRETNTFSDVLPGVTFGLKKLGTATVTVNDDPDKIVEQVESLVTAFNELVGFVAGESKIEQLKDKLIRFRVDWNIYGRQRLMIHAPTVDAIIINRTVEDRFIDRCLSLRFTQSQTKNSREIEPVHADDQVGFFDQRSGSFAWT